MRKSSTTKTKDTPSARQQAMRDIRGLLDAIPQSQLLKVRWDPSKAAKRVLEHFPRIAPYLPRIAKLPEVNQLWVNNLDKIALAMLAASDRRPSSKNQVRPDIVEAYRAGLELKETLRDCTKLLVKRSVLPAHCANYAETHRGYVKTGKSLLEFSELFSRYAAAVRGKVPLTVEDVARARELGELLSTYGDDRYHQEGEEAAELLFLRAHTLLCWAYEETRRCIRFLDAKAEARVVPTLFPRRPKSKVFPFDDEGPV